ncbi:hypothetical protein ACFO4E_04150 [Nocardiopsis mangrovi]|uniref:HEXXH motif domain-containing protein n=1 Tax=Nocardiopsis mangrovi TaxID=1179818 RepID=A0ABV9DTW2_9ACTN
MTSSKPDSRYDFVLSNLRTRRQNPPVAIIAFLERLQESLLDDHPSPAASSRFHGKAMRSEGVAEEKINQISEVVNEMGSGVRAPTRFEDFGLHVLLQEFGSRIEEEAVRFGWGKKVEQLTVVFGQVRTGRANARTVRVPGSDDYLILVDQNLMEFLYTWSLAVVKALPRGKKMEKPDGWLSYDMSADRIRTHLKKEPRHLSAFCITALEYALQGHPTARRQMEDTESQELAGMLMTAGILFVLAHEYMHIIADGPLQYINQAHTKAGGDVHTVGSIAQESIVDGMAFWLAASAMEKYKYPNATFTYWGAVIFLHCSQLMFKTIAILRGGDEGHMNDKEKLQHDLYEFRMDLLVKSIRNAADSFDVPIGGWGRISKNLNLMSDVISELWTFTVPFLEWNHEEGMRPSVTWAT